MNLHEPYYSAKRLKKQVGKCFMVGMCNNHKKKGGKNRTKKEKMYKVHKIPHPDQDGEHGDNDRL